MDITLATPALLFPAVSLLMLAYTNKFLGLASVIRQLYSDFLVSPHPITLAQIVHLRRRIRLIRDMQFYGVLSLFFCVVCMGLLLQDFQTAARWVFVFSLGLMMVSLLVCLMEIFISVDTLNLLLKAMEKDNA